MSNLLQFKTGLVQAPLAGYSCAPMRKLAWQWGQPDFCCTEMLSAKHIVSDAPQKERYRYKDSEEGPLCIQLSGSNPDILAKATEQVLQWGADLIDLNCGCPMPKIRGKHEGSKLLADSTRLAKLIKAIKSVSSVPVLIKIRVDGDSDDDYHLSAAIAAQDAGIDAISVHGRHWTERYDTPARYEEIAEIKAKLHIPVIGNGDVCDAHSAKKLLSETQCDAIMIARASLGQPWLFAQIAHELQGKPYTPPGLKEIGLLFLEHIRGLIKLEGEKVALLQSRKLAKYYIRHHLPSDTIEPLQNVTTYSELEELVRLSFVGLR